MEGNLSPEKIAKKAISFYKDSDYLQAAVVFEEAAEIYALNHQVLDAAEMANTSSVAYLQGDDPERALKAVQGTEEVFAEAGDIKRQGMALANKASALDELNQVTEAIKAYKSAADLLEEAGEDKLRADVMKSLSMLQLQEGKQIEALLTMQDGLNSVKHPSPKQSLIKKLLQVPFNFLGK